MTIVIILAVVGAGLLAEALIFAPEKFPWNKRRNKK